MVIETARLRLRELEEADHARLLEIYRDPRYQRLLGPPPPEEDYWRSVRARWPAYYREHGYGHWAVVRRDDGAFLGRCGLLLQEVDGTPEVEVGYGFDPAHWGQGYATEAARAVRDWAFRRLEVRHLVSLILPENLPSLGVAERNGMGWWTDADFRGQRVRVYRITRGEWEAEGEGT